jgi:tetratricopeptide (TPR) repeat protein
MNPGVNPTKYLYMGQLHRGFEALEYFSKGFSILEEQASIENSKAIKHKMISCLCSMAEIYLTDLCDEPNAENQCRSFLSKALLIDESHFETNCLMVTLNLCLNNREEAKIYLISGLKSWLPAFIEKRDLTNLPPYELRLNIAKNLIECELYEESLDVLSSLEIENDEEIDIWNLYGISYMAVKDYEASQECFQKCIEVQLNILFHLDDDCPG